MARTVVLKKVWVDGDAKEVLADVTLDNSYPAAGYPLTGADLGLELELRHIDVGMAVKADNTLAVICSHDGPNNTIRCWKSNTAANQQPVGTGGDLTGYVVRVHATGKGSAGV